jgi:excisionase family DNA binding protein
MTYKQQLESDLLTPGEVASLFRVDPKTVTRWAVSGKLPYITTLGGHRRYREEDIKALMEDHTTNVRT